MAAPPRSAVVDLGSNSVRLVVFDGGGPIPVSIFNEKAVLRLGRGLQATGLLNADAVEQALIVLPRFAAVARAMGAEPFEVLATAAVRDARNGSAFIAELQSRIPDLRIRILSGRDEAALSAAGLLCGIPEADGILADIGGGSLELVGLAAGQVLASQTLRLGVIRLAERAEGDPLRARAIAQADLAEIAWLDKAAGRDLYLVGGAWRAIARVHMALTNYPLSIVHHYEIERETARELTSTILAAPRRVAERAGGSVRKRQDDLPYAAVVLRRLLRMTAVRRVVFSANGLREGWYRERLAPEIRQQDGLLWACRMYAGELGRDMRVPPALIRWTADLFAGETAAQRRLREAACWLSDIGSHDHPDYRAEQAFLRILRKPGVAIDHKGRVFLALAVAIRYDCEIDAPFLLPLLPLLPPDWVQRAVALGCALRLAYTLSAGTADLLTDTRLATVPELTLQLGPATAPLAGEPVTRLLERLREALGREVLARQPAPARV